jgi:hypothetical protein
MESIRVFVLSFQIRKNEPLPGLFIIQTQIEWHKCVQFHWHCSELSYYVECTTEYRLNAKSKCFRGIFVLIFLIL